MSSEEPLGQIVAMGGGGFSTEPDNPLLDDFVLSLVPRRPARVCFVPTASADSAVYLANFYRAFAGRSAASDLTLFDAPSLRRRPATTGDLTGFVAEQDVLYVGGGSTANLLALWRAHGLDRLVKDAWRRGTILCGVSAGMLCWFSGGVTDAFGELDALDDGLGLIDASACPHYDSEAERRPTYRRLIGDGRLGSGYAADDGVALHFRGTRLIEAVASTRGSAAYRVELVDGQVIERALVTRYLGDP